MKNSGPVSRFTLMLAAFLGLAAASTPAPAAAAAPAQKRPNIFFIILDDWGWQDSGAYGSTWVKTPNIDRVAREGVRFASAFTSNPKCSPCRASILTGRNTWQLEEASCHNGIFPNKFTVYPDLVEQAGYTIGLTGKGWGPGDYRAGGFTRNPAGPEFNEHTTNEVVASGINRRDYVRNVAEFLKQRPADKPFCFWLGFHEPHRAYELNSGVRLGKNLDEITVPPYFPDLPGVRGDLADYAIEVEATDAAIGRVITMLQETGELDNTLLIVTSDHGMPFPFVKGQIHEDGFRLPLLMRWPATIKPGRVVEDFVSVSDYAPTFLEIAGVPVPTAMTGRSLMPQLRATESGWIDRNRATMIIAKERHDIGRPHDWGYPVRAIRTPEFLFVFNYHPERWPAGNPETDFGNVDGGPTKEILKAIGGYYYDLSFGKRPQEALFYLPDDPAGLRDLAGDPAFKPVMEQLREQMFARLRAERDPRALGNGAIFDTYHYLGARAKGYETWLKKQEEKAGAAVRPKQDGGRR